MFLKKQVLQNIQFFIVVTQAVSTVEVLDSTDQTIQVNITKTHGNNKSKDLLVEVTVKVTFRKELENSEIMYSLPI